jgi:hypothetical protein
VFLKSLGSLHIFAILGSILFSWRFKERYGPAFIKFQIASVDKSRFYS